MDQFNKMYNDEEMDKFNMMKKLNTMFIEGPM